MPAFLKRAASAPSLTMIVRDRGHRDKGHSLDGESGSYNIVADPSPAKHKAAAIVLIATALFIKSEAASD